MRCSKELSVVFAGLALRGFAAAGEPVRASAFGYDPSDATKCLQAAFDSGARDILIDRQAGDWISGPVFVRSHQRVTLDEGVVIRAKEGAFPGRFDSLVSISNATDVVFRGRKGSALVMNKPEYMDGSRCAWGEWRHALNLWHATNVKAGGFRTASSGGDGVYVRNTKDVTLQRIVSEDNLRQGISVIGAERLLVKDCVFRTTAGAAPQCGLDIEPNGWSEKLVDVVFEDCVFERNRSAGIDLHLANQRSRSTPMDIVFRRCLCRDNAGDGITSFIGRGDPPTGTILFEDCRAVSETGYALSVRNMFENGPVMTFRNCEFDARRSGRAAVHLNMSDVLDSFGNLVFENCRALTDAGVEAVIFPSQSGAGMGAGVKGTLAVESGTERSVVDLAEFARKHPPNRDIIDFRTRPFEYRDLVPCGSALNEEPPRCGWFRGNVTFVQHVPAAGEWPVRIDACRLTRGALHIPVKLRDRQSTDLGDFVLTEPTTNFVIRTRGEDVIRFEVAAGRDGVCFRSRWPGQGYLANGLTRVYKAGGAAFSFFQPEADGTTLVDVTPEESVAARLAAPDGTVAARMPQGLLKTILKAPARRGEWRLEIPSADEDFLFRIGAPALPLVSTVPGLGLRLGAADDDTEFLQKKLDSGARRIVLPRRPRPYSVESLTLRSNTELVLEEGVVIEARKGSFTDRFATLLTLRETTNAVVRGLGAGATVRMHRDDYRKPPYAASEYRHAFNLLGVRQVTLENLTISSSGGDGVYAGAVKRNGVWRDCENLTVRNCRIEDNNRQAISVISAKGLRVENCRLLRTGGALPMAGVDFEPNDPGQRLVDCLFRGCEISGNAREGVFFATGNLKAGSTPVSIRFEDCRLSGNGTSAVNVTPSVSVRPEDAVGGRAEFVRCTFDCSSGERGVVVERKTSRGYRVVFTDCTLVEPADDWKGHVAVELGAGTPGEPFADGFTFDRFTVRQPSLRPWCRLERENYSRVRPCDWRGRVTRVAPDGTRAENLDTDWCARTFPPPPDETLPRVAGDFSKAAVVDPHPGEMRPLSPFAVRMHGRFVFFAARAGRVAFRYRYDRMPDYPNEFPKLSLSLLDLGGRTLKAFEPQACSPEERTLVCDVPSQGFYRLSSEASAYAALTFLASEAPFAIDTSAERLETVYSSGSLRFHVPAGKRVGFFLSNDPGEYVNVTVSDASGRVRLDLADFSDVLRREQLPASEADGFWRVDFAKSAKSRLRKFHFHLIGVAGCLFPDSERGWRF